MFNLNLKDEQDAEVQFIAVNGGTTQVPAEWETTTADVPLLQRSITVLANYNKARTAKKVSVRLRNPIQVSLCGGTSCELHSIPVNLDFTFPTAVPGVERETVLALLISALSDENLKAAIVNAVTPA